MKVQRVVRTHPSQTNALNETLNKGWIVVHITPMADYIEYIVQKDVNPVKMEVKHDSV